MPRRKPRGRQLPREDETLERLRQISTSDVEDAQELARRDMPPDYVDLLNARVEEAQ